MKASMTGFDVRAVSQELDSWAGAYVKKAYMPHYNKLFFVLIQKNLTSLIWSLCEDNACTPLKEIDQCR